MPRETFQIHIADRTVELVRDGESFFLDGRPLDVSVRRTTGDHVSVLVNGRSLSVCIESTPSGNTRLRTREGACQVEVVGNRERLLRMSQQGDNRAKQHFAVRAPMPGLIVKVNVQPGDVVREGDPLIALEAMKMENEIRAPHSGTVARVHVNESDAVLKNALLVEFESR